MSSVPICTLKRKQFPFVSKWEMTPLISVFVSSGRILILKLTVLSGEGSCRKSADKAQAALEITSQHPWQGAPLSYIHAPKSENACIATQVKCGKQIAHVSKASGCVFSGTCQGATLLERDLDLDDNGNLVHNTLVHENRVEPV